jgi:hypothetical protein
MSVAARTEADSGVTACVPVPRAESSAEAPATVRAHLTSDGSQLELIRDDLRLGRRACGVRTAHP